MTLPIFPRGNTCFFCEYPGKIFPVCITDTRPYLVQLSGRLLKQLTRPLNAGFRERGIDCLPGFFLVNGAQIAGVKIQIPCDPVHSNRTFRKVCLDIPVYL